MCAIPLSAGTGCGGVNKQIWEFTLTAPARFLETADNPGRYRMSSALPQKATTGTASVYSNIGRFRPWGQVNQNSWVVAVHEASIYLSPPSGSDITGEELNALLDDLRAAGTPLTIAYQLNTPLWIPLSDKAQAVLDSIRLPAGVANIFATNSPAPDLELTYRKTVISLPTPDTSYAGKVPVVTATGDGYELTTPEVGANYSRTFTVEEAVDAYAITDINPAEYCRFVVTMRNTEYQDAVTFKIVASGKRLSTTIATHSNVIAECNYAFDQQFAMTIRMQGNNLTALLSSVAAIRYADSAAAGLHFAGHLGAGTIIQVLGYKL